MIRKFLHRRYAGQGLEYDDYFQQGITEQRSIMVRLQANRSKAYKLRFKAKPGDMRIVDLMAEIKKDEMSLWKIRARSSEQAFGSRNDEESVNDQIDLHG